MPVLLLLIIASLSLALGFLAFFIWAVRSGQYEDTCTPAMRLLTEERSLNVAAQQTRDRVNPRQLPSQSAPADTNHQL